MAKFIKYKLCTVVNYGTGKTEEILTAVTMDWSEANEKVAKEEAYNGEYTIEEGEIH